MKAKEIQTKLLAYYKEKLEGLPESIGVISDYLRDNKIHGGMCYCAEKKFKTEIYNEKWVYSKCRYGFLNMYWAVTPAYAIIYGRDAVIAALQTRIDILQSLVNQHT